MSDWLPYAQTSITALALLWAIIVHVRAHSLNNEIAKIHQKIADLHFALGPELMRQSLPVLLHERAPRHELYTFVNEFRDFMDEVNRSGAFFTHPTPPSKKR